VRRFVVIGPDGTRWNVRVRRGRVPESRLHGGSATDRTLPVLLEGILGRRPLPADHPAVIARDDGDSPSTGMAATAIALDAPKLWIVWDLVVQFRERHEPSAPGRRWLVELDAAGRLRRGAVWLLDHLTADARAAAEVAAAIGRDVAEGRSPHVDGTTLVDVVDRRPNHPGVYR
jgi:hypothetical protein